MLAQLEHIEYDLGTKSIVPFDPNQEYFKRREAADADRLSDISRLVQDGATKVLELGAAPYIVTAEFLDRGMEVTANGLPFDGVTSLMARLTVAGRVYQVPIDLFDAEMGLPYANESFDVIVAGELFEHFYRKPWYFLAESWRCLRENGQLILTTPNGHSLSTMYKFWKRGPTGHGFNPDYPSQRHAREYSVNEMERLLYSQGFSSKVWTKTYSRIERWPGLLGPVKHLVHDGVQAMAARPSGLLHDRASTILVTARKTERLPSDPPAFMIGHGGAVGDPRTGGNFSASAVSELASSPSPTC
ncbi:MAG TPA: methyltransferase domain-containing protein [Acidimicrobiales bacterium]|nr:methyltransferase domain-containing protein [Acidimicrobiales bacterium]